MACSLIGDTTLTIWQGNKTPFVDGQVETPNASLQTIELNPRCSGQAHFKGPRTDPGNDSMEYGHAFGILCAPSMIRPLSCEDAWFR